MFFLWYFDQQRQQTEKLLKDQDTAQRKIEQEYKDKDTLDKRAADNAAIANIERRRNRSRRPTLLSRPSTPQVSPLGELGQGMKKSLIGQ